MDTVGYLKQKGHSFKQQGQEYLMQCIFCDDRKMHLSVNGSSGRWHCWKCGEAGNIWKFKKHFGDIMIAPFFKEKQYKIPEQEKHVKFHNNLLANKEALTFLKQERGFKDETIKHFKLGLSNKNIAIPYFKDGICVNFKYRSIITKSFIREKDCESVLFNSDDIDIKKPLLIVEGEMDCIAGWQMGFKNIVSVSVGAESISEKWLEFFDNFDKIYLAYDNDKKGSSGALKLSKRLDCEVFRVLLPQKDLNDCLMSGFTKEEILSSITEAKKYKNETIVHVAEVLQEMEDFIFNGENVLGLQIDKWKKFNKQLGGIRKGEVTIITGDTGTGKTTWLVNLFYKLILKDNPVLFISSEMPNKILMQKMCSIYIGKEIQNMEKEEIKKYIDAFLFKSIYFFKNIKNITIKEIETNIQYAKKRLNINYVMIDHLHHFLPSTEKQVFEIENFMRRIKGLSIENDMHIFMIVHPHMLKDQKSVVNMNQLKGSSAIKQDADNVISIWRDREHDTNTLQVYFQKVRDDAGKEGHVEFMFLPEAQCYYEDGKNDK